MLILLWIHETSRQFRDRLLSDDIPWFDNEIKLLYEGKLQMKKDTLPVINELIFTDLKEKCYKINSDINLLHKRINDELDSYNTASRSGQMKLVFFTDAINHFCRIARILSLARGNALLIGLGGSGRQSLTKLVVFALKQEMNTLQIAKGYGVELFLKDIGKILKKSGGINEGGGVGDNKKQAFLFSDTQILQESFLEDINNILNNGEVPNLFKDDEMAVIFNTLKDKAKEAKYAETKDGVYQYFVATVRDSLHIVLSFSPVGSSFRNRCIQFPSIINCCTIDWFNVWPDNALKSVAERYLKTIGETLRGQPANTIKPLEGRVITQLSIIFVEIQKKALELSTRFQNELRRYYYITPTSYLEFIKLFIDIYNEKIKIIPTQIQNYKLGIRKLNEANEIVKQLKEDLIILEPQQIEGKKNVEEMIVVLEDKKKIVGAEREKIQGEKDEVDKQRSVILKIKEECDAEMATAKPKLDAAKDALSKLKEDDLFQLRSFLKPSQNILNLAKNICFVFDCKGTEYSDFKILINDVKRFKENCQNEAMMVKKLNDPRKLKELGNLFELIKEIDFLKVSMAADGLKTYVGALLEYVKVYRQVKPKMDQQEKATKELMAVEEKLEEKSKFLNEKEAELKTLQKEYDQAVKKLNDLAYSIKMINIKMVRAGKLVDGLKDEGVRWKEKIIELSKEAKNLLANVIISSTVVSYFGPFTMEYRKEFLDATKEYVIKAGVHYSASEEEAE
jgi:dynein heavy chain